MKFASCHPDKKHMAFGLCRSCYHKQYWVTYNNKEKTKVPARKKYWNALRNQCLIHYSQDPPSCACCKETCSTFLVIDHINGGGTKHRKIVGKLYLWLKRNNFPPGFRVLCHNCNWAYRLFGKCPHLDSTALELLSLGGGN